MYDSPSFFFFFCFFKSPLHPGGLATPSVGEPGNCTMGKGEKGEISSRAMMVRAADRMITGSIDGFSQGGGGCNAGLGMRED